MLNQMGFGLSVYPESTDPHAKRRMMKRKRPTMYDVAELAGVSQPTVSRVLNRNKTSVQISEETRQRVFNAVRELGYQPNMAARSLRTQRSQTIAMLIADLANGFYHPMARAVQDVAHEYGYEVVFSNSDHLYKNEKHFCDIVLRRGVDGVIMVPIHLTTEDLTQFVLDTHIPMAVLGEQIEHPNIDVVRVDDEKAVYEATLWMIEECGHTAIGWLGVPEAYPPGPRRMRGFTRAMQDANLPLNPDWIIQAGNFTRESGVKMAHQLIKTGELPTALFVMNDLMAIGAMLTLQDIGYTIPEDISVVGFDDIDETTIIRPRLTTIAQYPRDIGTKLATALFERIDDPEKSTRRVIESPTDLIIRESTHAIK